MLLDVLLEAFATDWSRAWVRIRGLAVAVMVLVLPPAVLSAGLQWYGERITRPIVRQIQQVVADPPPAQSVPGRAPAAPAR